MSFKNGVQRVEEVFLAGSGEHGVALATEAQEDIRRATRGRRYRRYIPMAVKFVRKNNYTCAIIELLHSTKGTVAGVGFAKRRPTDKYDPAIGARIAMKRAIEDAVNA